MSSRNNDEISTTEGLIVLLLVLVAGGLMLWYASSRLKPLDCHPDIQTFPPFLSLEMCASQELETGTTRLERPDGKLYFITLGSVNESGAFFELTVRHPDHEKPFQYRFSEVLGLSDTLLVGEIGLQRYIGKWYIRFPSTWKYHSNEEQNAN